MIEEIGGEFALEKKTVSAGESIFEWLARYGWVFLTSSGRGAISLMLEKVKGDTVLLPAYLCESMIRPFKKRGYECRFYEINEDLTPNTSSILNLLPADVFVHMGYFGYDTNINLGSIIETVKQGGTLIVEDITHTLFSRWGSRNANNFCIASLRKWIGIPSGGFLASNQQQAESKSINEDRLFVDMRTQALKLKAQYISDKNKSTKREHLDLVARSEEHLDCTVDAFNIDSLSLEILRNLGTDQIYSRRRANFKTLLSGMEEVIIADPVFSEIPEHVCPAFFPVYTKVENTELQAMLAERGIYCPIHWPIPEKVAKTNNEKAIKIYNSILSIPCDQRYGGKDMVRVINALRSMPVSGRKTLGVN